MTNARQSNRFNRNALNKHWINDSNGLGQILTNCLYAAQHTSTKSFLVLYSLRLEYLFHENRMENVRWDLHNSLFAAVFLLFFSFFSIVVVLFTISNCPYCPNGGSGAGGVGGGCGVVKIKPEFPYALQKFLPSKLNHRTRTRRTKYTLFRHQKISWQRRVLRTLGIIDERRRRRQRWWWSSRQIAYTAFIYIILFCVARRAALAEHNYDDDNAAHANIYTHVVRRSFGGARLWFCAHLQFNRWIFACTQPNRTHLHRLAWVTDWLCVEWLPVDCIQLIFYVLDSFRFGAALAYIRLRSCARRDDVKCETEMKKKMEK